MLRWEVNVLIQSKNTKNMIDLHTFIDYNEHN